MGVDAAAGQADLHAGDTDSLQLGHDAADDQVRLVDAEVFRVDGQAFRGVSLRGIDPNLIETLNDRQSLDIDDLPRVGRRINSSHISARAHDACARADLREDLDVASRQQVERAPGDAGLHEAGIRDEQDPAPAEAVDLVIPEGDIRIDVKRASGHGGQGVNTTDSAVRITHLPSGTVVEMQDERSQLRNKEKGMAILRSRLLAAEEERTRSANSAARKALIGSGDRSEKIRTYNGPQNRVTDHRIGLDKFDVDGVLNGEFAVFHDALAAAEQAERLAGD